MPDDWAIIGIVLTVAFGIASLFMAKKIKKNRQEQSVGDGSTGLQAGGDIRINGNSDD